MVTLVVSTYPQHLGLVQNYGVPVQSAQGVKANNRHVALTPRSFAAGRLEGWQGLSRHGRLNKAKVFRLDIS